MPGGGHRMTREGVSVGAHIQGESLDDGSGGSRNAEWEIVVAAIETKKKMRSCCVRVCANVSYAENRRRDDGSSDRSRR
ncbi:hypothetical protein RB195_008923 [Necator americanus]|uniref:Uncharacterized protein n=1 Tax=Necator americanus TaxID=51031 RepID=A0ABR1CR00_NECAM